MAKIYLNGKFVDEQDAKISVKDRGFRFGDGAFETIAFYNGTPYLLADHLYRLAGGLSAIKIEFDVHKLPAIIDETIKQNELKDGFARIMVTRGEGSRGYMPTYKSPPTLVVEAMAPPEMKTETANLCVSRYRRISFKALPTEFKLMQGLNSTLAKIEAKEKGFFEALMMSDGGAVAEVSAGNIFFVKDGKVFTPTLRTGALGGVMRKNIMRLLGDVEEGFYSVDKLAAADEIFISNTAWKVLPVNVIEGVGFEPRSDVVFKKVKDLIQSDIKEKC